MKNRLFYLSAKRYLLLQFFLILITLIGSKNSHAFYKWVDEKGVVHFTDQPANRKQAEAAKIEAKTKVKEPEALVKYNDDFDATELDKGWLKKNISDESANLLAGKGFLKLRGDKNIEIKYGMKMPILYRAIKNCKNCDIKLYFDFTKSFTDSEKKYSGLIFFQDEVEDSWFLIGARRDKFKMGKFDLGGYKEIASKKVTSNFEKLVILVRKREGVFSFYFSEDDGSWEELGKKEGEMEIFNVGIFSETDSKGANQILIDKFSFDSSTAEAK